MNQNPILGCLLGTAAGDAIGLPYEGLSRQRAVKLLGKPDRHRLLFGRGMISDDTEHTYMVAQSLIAAKGNVDLFRSHFANRLRIWLLTLPAGIGFATLRAIIKLWLGFKPGRSGVFSAGNGPAMRAAVLGVTVNDVRQIRPMVQASTRITHTDPKAELGAFAVALASHFAAHRQPIDPAEYLNTLSAELGDEAEELIELLTQASRSVEQGESTIDFVEHLGLKKGVTGYVYHTVPVAIHAWLKHQNQFKQAIMAVIECGGDTDTVAAITGGIIGAGVGETGVPGGWVKRITDRPLSTIRLRELATQLSVANPDPTGKPPNLLFLSQLARNLFFLSVVLIHGVRRLLPPY